MFKNKKLFYKNMSRWHNLVLRQPAIAELTAGFLMDIWVQISLL
tara:strand:- start:2926 stop:3057 length:132 start_codon:yes stop_codon:yes gene_type:complete